MKVKHNGGKAGAEHPIKTPWHLWFIGVFFLLVYSIGVYDYVMVHSSNMDYLNSLAVRGDVVAYFSDYPLGLSVIWAINVFSGITAAILLLFRKKWAVWGGLTATISMLFLSIMTFTFLNRWAVFGPLLSLIDIGILLMTAGFFFYTRALAKRGVL